MKISFLCLLLSSIVMMTAPSSNAQWVQTNGPDGGTVHAFAVNGWDLYAATDGGVFLSIDNGANWYFARSGLPYTPINALAIIGSTIFAGTAGNGVYVSTNRGTSWKAANAGIDTCVVNALAVIGTNLYAAVYWQGVFVSTDYGSSWNPVNTGLPVYNVTCLAVSGTNLYAGTNGSGLYLSTNAGTQWAKISAAIYGTFISSIGVNGSMIYAGTEYGLFRTTDNGANWSTGSSIYSPSAFAFIGSNAFAAQLGVQCSTDGGVTWNPANTGLLNSRAYALMSNGTTLYAGTNMGAFLSTDSGNQWVRASKGLGCTHMSALANDGETLFAGTPGGAFRSTNGGADWALIIDGLSAGGNSVNSFAVKYSNVYAATGAGVYWSTNSGDYWMNTGLQGNSTYAIVPTIGITLVAGTGSGLYISTNNGFSWDAEPHMMWVLCLAVSSGDVIAGTRGWGLWRSTDYGLTWAHADSNMGNRRVYSLATDGLRLFAAMDSGVFRSTDNGQNWVKTSAGLPAGYATTLFASSAFLFAGTNRGVYCSGNGGDSWKWVSENLVSTAVYSFAVVGTDLYAGTSAYGVWKRPLLEMTSVEPGGTELPLRYGLEQNYPNPFNPNTTIRYGLPQKSRVTLTVFNTLGQQIAQLVNGEEEAGYHELRFDGSTLASGVYFYRIQVRPLDSAIGPASPAGGRDSKSGAGSFVEAKKFILLR